MRTVRWVQQDWLRAPGTEPAVYVFDEEAIAGCGLKRIQFLYECLLELPVEIRRGRCEDEVADFAAQHGADGIVTAAAPDPRVRLALERLAERFTVHIEQPEPFAAPAREPDLKRFSRYWACVEPLLLPPEARRR